MNETPAGRTEPPLRDAPDGDAFLRQALARHEGPLVAYAERLVGDLERARDLAQETFLELLNQRRADVEPRLGAWLFTVCRNRAHDARRKESRMRSLTSSEEHGEGRPRGGAADPAHRLEQADTAARLLAELEALPEREREVLRLKFQSGFAYREIADVTGLSVGNVGFLIHRGLQTLRSRLEPLRRMEVGS